MPRFYNSPQAEFREDFIFQPNWELASQALLKKDEDLREVSETLSLLDRLPIEYWGEVDRGNVEDYRRELSEQVNEIASQLSTNSGNNRYLVNSLRNKVLDDFESGRLKEISDRNKARLEYLAQIENMESESEKELYRSLISRFEEEQENPGRETRKFTPPSVVEQMPYWNNFVESGGLKGLVADGSTVSIDRATNRWVVTDTQGNQTLAPQKIIDAFTAYMNSDPNFRRRAEIGQQYFGETDWFDENNNFDFSESGRLGRSLIPGASSLSYSNTTRGKGLRDNAEYLANLNANNQIRVQKALNDLQGQKDRENISVVPNKDASFVANFTPEGKRIREDYLNRKRQFISMAMTDEEKRVISGPFSIEHKQKTYDEVEKRMLQNEVTRNGLNQLHQNYLDSQEAGFQQFQQNFRNQADADKVMNFYNSPDFEQIFQNQNVYVDFGEDPDTGKRIARVDSKGQAIKVRVNSLINTKVKIPGFKGQTGTIQKVTPVRNTGMPLNLLPDYQKDGDISFKGGRMDYTATVLNPYYDEDDESMDWDEDAKYIEIPFTVYDTENTFNISQYIQ